MLLPVLILGLVLGSFLGAFTYRFPRGVSVAKGRSFCPKCKKKIVWYSNIPVLSFVLLGGKCRNCRKKISLRYPLIEFGTAVVFVLLYKFGIIYFAPLVLILISIFVIDLEHQIIPDELIFAGVIVALLFPIYNSLYTNLLAGFAAASFLLILHLITRGRGMGLGDVKLAILGGMIVGLNNVFYWLALAFLTGAIIGCILILGKFAGLKSKIAFGPFLILALLYEILFQIRI